jgi:hypothetical protein
MYAIYTLHGKTYVRKGKKKNFGIFASQLIILINVNHKRYSSSCKNLSQK